MNRIWLKQYPAGVPHDIDPSVYPSLLELMAEGFQQHARQTAYCFMGRSWRFEQIDAASQAMGAYLQSLGLDPGARVGIMMPNFPQYPVAVAAILRAGYVLVNINPMYTPRELKHQLLDSGCKAIFILENVAATLQAVLADTAVQHTVLVSVGDMLGWVHGGVVNHVVRRIKKRVPAFNLPNAVSWHAALSKGRGLRLRPAHLGPQDLAVLQYTGGTTGVSKGAMLTHRNIIANLLQSEAWHAPLYRLIPKDEQRTIVCALPLYHIFGFTVSMMQGLRTGACNILIPNPRDAGATLKALSRYRFHSFPAVSTLYNTLVRHPDFDKVDWRHLRLCVSGGMALQQATAKLWKERTDCAISEGYGLSETSPSVSCNPVNGHMAVSGSIGLPLPSTEMVVLDEQGQVLPPDMPGELAVRGPQVMAGYWQRPYDTAKVMTRDGFFRTGDIATVDQHGYFKIIDRKKDMILVSGFNVYPNEIEDVASQLPGVFECAAVGVPDALSGEAVKLVVVRHDPALTEHDVREHCAKHLTGYKRPRTVVFVNELPKTPVGKILRRALREAEAASRETALSV